MAMDKAVRILVANRPKLMRELLLGTLEDQPWIEIVGEVSDDSEILDHVHRTTPDLLVIATDEPGKRPLICDSLLQQYPELRIIAVAPHKNYSVFYWATLDIHSDDIEPSEEGILSAVRSVAESTSRRSGEN
jgi:chemotaxis response regulator CheB